MNVARRGAGLTLIEVLIAVVLLGVGVLAAAGLQVTGLRAARTARLMQQLNTTATVEMDSWRGTRLALEEPLSTSCSTTGNAGCTVEVQLCSISGVDLICGGQRVAEVAAYAITVTVETEGRSVELRTVVMP